MSTFDPPPPPSPAATEPGPKPTWWKRRWLKLPVWAWILIVVVLGGAAAAGGGGKKNGAASDTTVATTVVVERSEVEITTTSTEPAATDAPTTPPTTIAATPPPTTVAKGSQTNPYQLDDALTYGDYNPVTVGPVELVDPALITAANSFNEAAPDGQAYVRVPVTATYTGAGTGTYSDIMFSWNLVGDKAKIYESSFDISDGSGPTLDKFSDQPDVLAGGTITGFLYYLIDADDANFMIITKGTDGNQFVDVSP